MIHQDFQNVRSFRDFAAVSIPWPCSMNDRARLWNMLVRMNENRDGHADLTVHTALFNERDFNVSFGSYFGSVSKITKLYRYILQNRRLRISGNARTVNNEVVYSLSLGTSANELLNAWNPTEIVPYQGRGLSTPRASRANRTRPNRPVAASAAPRIETINMVSPQRDVTTQNEVSETRNRERQIQEGYVFDGGCNCEECRTIRRAAFAEQRREQEMSISISRMMNGFSPFDNLSASVMATLMLEAAT